MANIFIACLISPANAMSDECTWLRTALNYIQCNGSSPTNTDDVCARSSGADCERLMMEYGDRVCTCKNWEYDMDFCIDYFALPFDCESDRCSTCNITKGTPVSTNITGGTRTSTPITKSCASGCTCTDCSGNSYIYSCHCNIGYTIINQGTSNCSCQRNGSDCGNGTYGTYDMDMVCNTCPSLDDYSGTPWPAQSAATAYFVDQCYMPPSVTLSDASGSFQFTQNCYHSTNTYGPDSRMCKWFRYAYTAACTENSLYQCDPAASECWYIDDGQFCEEFNYDYDACIEYTENTTLGFFVADYILTYGCNEYSYIDINTPCDSGFSLD